MIMPSGEPISAGFISLGCPKNLVDSEHMASLLLSNGVGLAPRVEDADVVIVNTCAFIGDARRESVDAILDACSLKRKGRCRAVVVTGCLPQRYRKDLARSLPEVDAFVGLDAIGGIARIVAGAANGARTFSVPDGESRSLYEPQRGRVLFTGGVYAYLKVAEGCNHRCSFCAVPLIRGRYRSRSVASIVKEAEGLLEQGVRELNVISQDTASYGLDLKDGSDLSKLLRRLDKIGGRFWIRIMYVHPSHVDRRMLETMAELPRVCKYLDMPVQHSHPEILKAMGRPSGPRSAVRSLPGLARSIMPDISLRTSLIVGFPGERSEHFRHLQEYVKEMKFENLGVFTYSLEEGTRAASLPGRVPDAVSSKRRRALMLAQQAMVIERGRKRVGHRDGLLIEKRVFRSKSAWLGRSGGQAPGIDGETIVRGLPAGDQRGRFVRVEYEESRGYDMLARFVGPRGMK